MVLPIKLIGLGRVDQTALIKPKWHSMSHLEPTPVSKTTFSFQLCNDEHLNLLANIIIIIYIISTPPL